MFGRTTYPGLRQLQVVVSGLLFALSSTAAALSTEQPIPTFQVTPPAAQLPPVPFCIAAAICGTTVASVNVRPTESNVPLIVTVSYAEGVRLWMKSFHCCTTSGEALCPWVN